MPAIPIITTGLGIAGGISQINRANQEAAALQSQTDATRAQTNLNREQFDWQKQHTADELSRKLASSNAYWNEYNNTSAPTYQEAVTQASNELAPQYDEQMKNTLDQLNQNLMARGFFGQGPGAALTQEAAAKVEAAKQNAISNLANQFYQAGQNRRLQQQQMGLSTFGTYGTLPTTTNETPGTTNQVASTVQPANSIEALTNRLKTITDKLRVSNGTKNFTGPTIDVRPLRAY